MRRDVEPRVRAEGSIKGAGCEARAAVRVLRALEAARKRPRASHEAGRPQGAPASIPSSRRASLPGAHWEDGTEGGRRTAMAAMRGSQGDGRNHGGAGMRPWLGTVVCGPS